MRPQSRLRRLVVLALVSSASFACSKGSSAPAQRGIPAGNVAVGYLASNKPANADECVVVTVPTAEKAEWTDAKLGELAKVFSAKLVPGCSTEKVVGTCNAMKGLLVNYSSPGYSLETAKAACAKDHGTWVP